MLIIKREKSNRQEKFSLNMFISSTIPSLLSEKVWSDSKGRNHSRKGVETKKSEEWINFIMLFG